MEESKNAIEVIKDENIADLINSIKNGEISGNESLFKLSCTIGTIVGIFIPQVGLIKDTIVLVKEITCAILENPSKKDEKGNHVIFNGNCIFKA